MKRELIFSCLLTLLAVTCARKPNEGVQSRQILRQMPVIQPGLVRTRVCANGGRFIGSYCINDYNCNPGTTKCVYCRSSLFSGTLAS